MENETDKLKYRINKLEIENAFLKSLLNKNGISYESSSKQLSHQYSNKIDPLIINNETIIKFFSYFRGRKDVYARAYTNKTTGKISYFTQCNNFWKSGVCPKKNRV